MRVLLDTNVLASAAATRGLCADVLREVLAEHELVVCPQVLSELRRVLRGKFGVSASLINDFLGLIQQDTIHGILAAALDGGASFLVTGDKELLELGDVLGIRIMSPRQFWHILTAQPIRIETT